MTRKRIRTKTWEIVSFERRSEHRIQLRNHSDLTKSGVLQEVVTRCGLVGLVESGWLEGRLEGWGKLVNPMLNLVLAY